MGCGCGKKRMAQYSSKQLRRQASGEAVVASATEMSTDTGQADAAPAQSSVEPSAAPRAAAR